MRIIHAADFHLDSAFAQLSAEKARQRRRESREVLDTLAELVRKEHADLVLLAGDLFDGEQVYPETVERLQNALERMGCPVFISPGNHDPFTARSPYATKEWSGNVHIFRTEELSAVEIGELGCVVHGAAFQDQHRQSEALADFHAPEDGKIHLLCLHGAVNEPGSEYGCIRMEQIAGSGFDYLALGHIHQYSGEQKAGGSTWAYSGCPEGRGFDEPDDKGVILADVGKDGVALSFIPICKRRYRIIKVDVSGKTVREALEEAIPNTAAEDICRVIFTGETGEEGIDLRALEEDLTHRFFSLQLRDETRIADDIWRRAGEDSLRGMFLRELQARYDSAKNDEEKDLIVAAVRFGLAAMDGRDMG